VLYRLSPGGIATHAERRNTWRHLLEKKRL
jgi:hypothetical protein